jgi:hypothetical protein
VVETYGKPFIPHLSGMRKGKLYYVPGLISLLGLPILLYFLGPREPGILTTMTIWLPTDDMKPDPPGMIRFSKWRTYQLLKHKKIVTVDLNENEYMQGTPLHDFVYLKKLDFIAAEIARRQFTHDTGSVLKIRLGSNNTYGDFVWVFNQAHVYGIRRFTFVDDAYFLFTTPPPEPVQDLKVDLSNDVIYEPRPVIKREPSRWELFKAAVVEWWEKTLPIIKRSYIYVVGFLLLIIIPAINGLRKKNSPGPKKVGYI